MHRTVLACVAVLCMLVPLLVTAAPAQHPAQPGTIGYPTVSAALKALRNKPSVQIRSEHGWVIAADDESKTVWSFVPKDDPAYPAVVKRTVVQRNGRIYIVMRVLCEASKSACDQLVQRFR